jgi:hypothetical protein
MRAAASYVDAAGVVDDESGDPDASVETAEGTAAGGTALPALILWVHFALPPCHGGFRLASAHATNY